MVDLEVEQAPATEFDVLAVALVLGNVRNDVMIETYLFT
jgi:hypothetical protein